MRQYEVAHPSPMVHGPLRCVKSFNLSLDKRRLLLCRPGGGTVVILWTHGGCDGLPEDMVHGGTQHCSVRVSFLKAMVQGCLVATDTLGVLQGARFAFPLRMHKNIAGLHLAWAIIL